MPVLKSNVTKRGHSRTKASAVLPEPLCDRLNGYALAAGAAGVAALACAMPAEGTPICKTTSAELAQTTSVPLSPTGRGVAPFNIAQSTNSTFRSFTTTGVGTWMWWNRGFFTPNSAGANVLLSNGIPADVASGAEIGPGGQFGKGSSYGLLFTYGRGRYSAHGGGTKLKHKGNLSLVQDSFIGFQFSEAKQVHYGWARLHVSFVGGPNRKHTIIHVLGVGYEDTANTAIAAGNCTGAEQSDLAAASQSSRGSSLGMLALGSAAPAKR
ncbi:MAG: hypothetical protein WAN65_28490 [Candidatus Sulfotelmatobacter sp.]